MLIFNHPDRIDSVRQGVSSAGQLDRAEFLMGEIHAIRLLRSIDAGIDRCEEPHEFRIYHNGPGGAIPELRHALISCPYR